MKRMIRKTAKTVWRLPETLFSPGPVVVASRVMLILSVFSIAFSIFVVSSMFFSPVVALSTSVALAFVFLVTLVWSFSAEYYKVRELERIESRVLKVFHTFPEYSDINLMEAESGLWYAYGHVPEEKLKDDVCKIVCGVSGGELSADECRNSDVAVRYLYTTFDKSGESLSEYDFPKGTPHSFPISVLDIRGIVT